MAEVEARSQEWAARIEDLVRRAESLHDPNAKSVALDLLDVVMQFHAAGLHRILDIVSQTESGSSVIQSIAEDGLASSVLLLHELHPDSFDTRVHRALDRLRMNLNPRGANLALLGLEDGVVRLHYDSPRNGHIASARALIEAAIYEMAPEAVEVIIDGLTEQPGPDGFVPLASLFAGQAT